MTKKQMVDSLNRMLENDRKVISDLAVLRLPCNKKLANDPYCPVIASKATDCYNTAPYFVGLLGILNGLFPGKLIRAEFNQKTGLIEKFTLQK